MALVLISGLACSGRTSRTNELADALRSRLPSGGMERIVLIDDRTAHIARESYASQRTEKPARAAYLSAVIRALARDTIVLADGGAGLNIKGFRYQLWCAAREAGVRCVSVQVHAPAETCRIWNQARRERGEEAYDDDVYVFISMLVGDWLADEMG